MTATTLPNLSIKAGFTDSEVGWGDEMNAALRLLDALVQPRVSTRNATSPPGAAPGDLFIVGAGGTGEWAGRDQLLALWVQGDDIPNGQWLYIQPKVGWRVWVTDEAFYYQYNGGSWIKDETGGVTAERYSTPIGNGSSANFFIDHMLGTRDVSVTVRRNASPWDDIVVDVSRPSENQVEISGFASAVGVDEYIVVVKK